MVEPRESSERSGRRQVSRVRCDVGKDDGNDDKQVLLTFLDSQLRRRDLLLLRAARSSLALLLLLLHAPYLEHLGGRGRVP